MEQSTLIAIGVFIVNLLASALVGFFAAGAKIGEYKNRVDTLEATMGKDEHGGLRRTVGEMRDKVIACETKLIEREPFTKRKSPISLTDSGGEFLNESGGRAFIDDNLASLRDEVEAKGPKTAYDIQVFSREVIDGRKNLDGFIPLKEYLFKEGLELDDLVLVMGIYLRDKILSSKGLAPEEVDRTDPAKSAKMNQTSQNN